MSGVTNALKTPDILNTDFLFVVVLLRNNYTTKKCNHKIFFVAIMKFFVKNIRAKITTIKRRHHE